jgi:hypothetical protein|tara:strand:+ start:283 stop:606 length:324 start_codon:yes stop_codon:yes gene_type:complete
MRELQMDDNVITIDLSKHSTGMIDSTITVPTTINGLDADTYWTNDTGSEYIFNTSEPIVWKDTLPELEMINNMCKEYPALAKAFENFKTMYALVDQDYKGKQKERKL